MAAEEPEMHNVEEIRDLVECCICTDTFNDPRLLPCAHSFCLKCLQMTGSKKQPGELMACPVCTKEFTIPSDGFQGLQKNFFADRLLKMSGIFKPLPKRVLCDPCLETSDEDAGSLAPVAEVFCKDCNQSFCTDCYRQHRKFKGTNFHEVTAVDGKTDPEFVLQPTSCVHHGRVQLKIFCYDCKKVVCALCFVENHQMHKGADVVKVADDYRKQMNDTAMELKHKIEEVEGKSAQLEDDKLMLHLTVENIEKDGTRLFEELRTLGEKHLKILLFEIHQHRQEKLKELEKMKEDLNEHTVSLQSHIENIKDVLETGSAIDICQDMTSFTEKLGKLKTLHQNMKENRVRPYEACLVKTSLENFLKQGHGNILGIIQHTDDLPERKNKPSTQEDVDDKSKTTTQLPATATTKPVSGGATPASSIVTKAIPCTMQPSILRRH